MTIIAACKKNGVVCIGADSIGVSGNTVFHDCRPKLISKANYVLGGAGNFRVLDIIEESELLDFALNNLKDVAKFRDILFDEIVVHAHCSPQASGEDSISHPVNLIIATQSDLFTIDIDYQIHNIPHYTAAGAGRDFALGAMSACYQEAGSRQIVSEAIDAAIKHCTQCGGESVLRLL